MSSKPRVCHVVAARATGLPPVRAMALDVLAEWRLAMSSPAFGDWLARGAPSDDRPERSEST